MESFAARLAATSDKSSIGSPPRVPHSPDAVATSLLVFNLYRQAERFSTPQAHLSFNILSLCSFKAVHRCGVRSIRCNSQILTQIAPLSTMAKSIPNDIYQYSLLSAYNAGLKDGGPPVAFLTNHGTHGVGFFESDEDEPSERPNDVIQVDSVAYSLDKTGAAEKAEKEDQMPFVMVTVFQPAKRVKPPAGTTSKKVKELFEQGKNTPMPFRIAGRFKYIGTQQQTYWDVKGTIFGYCIPGWQKEISGDGLQSCYLSEDKKVGGRVLDFETGEGAILDFAKCGRFHLGFPQDDEFEQLRL